MTPKDPHSDPKMVMVLVKGQATASPSLDKKRAPPRGEECATGCITLVVDEGIVVAVNEVVDMVLVGENNDRGELAAADDERLDDRLMVGGTEEKPSDRTTEQRMAARRAPAQ